MTRQDSNHLQNGPAAGTETISPRQAKFLGALLTQATIADACKTTSVPESTAFLWLKEPTFSAAYREARREALAQATSRLTAAASEAVTALREIVTDETKPSPARVTAARSILEFATKTIELDDLAERLEQIEATLATIPQASTLNGKGAACPR